jgi:hypothetical protein
MPSKNFLQVTWHSEHPTTTDRDLQILQLIKNPVARTKLLRTAKKKIIQWIWNLTIRGDNFYNLQELFVPFTVEETRLRLNIFRTNLISKDEESYRDFVLPHGNNNLMDEARVTKHGMPSKIGRIPGQQSPVFMVRRRFGSWRDNIWNCLLIDTVWTVAATEHNTTNPPRIWSSPR